MTTPTPINLDTIEEARIELDALIGAFDDHRATMDPTSPDDLRRERQLYRQATEATHRLSGLESFKTHCDQAIDLTGGER